MIRNGQPAKREYRGQRSVEAFFNFVKKQLEDPIKEFQELTDLKNLDVSKTLKCINFNLSFHNIPAVKNFFRMLVVLFYSLSGHGVMQL